MLPLNTRYRNALRAQNLIFFQASVRCANRMASPKLSIESIMRSDPKTQEKMIFSQVVRGVRCVFMSMIDQTDDSFDWTDRRRRIDSLDRWASFVHGVYSTVLVCIFRL